MDDSTWRRLGAEIKRLRQLAGLTQKQLARRVGIATNTLASWERGIRHPGRESMRHLDSALNSGEELTGFWASMRGQRELPPEWEQITELERRAVEIREYHPALLPGIIQHTDYAYALLMASRQYSPERARALAEERAARLDRLWNVDITVVTRESVLRDVVGDTHTTHTQLAHLNSLFEHRRLRLVIIPQTAWTCPIPGGGFRLLTLQDGRMIVHVEHAIGNHVVSDTTGVQQLSTLFGDFLTAALSPADTNLLIRRIMEENQNAAA